jgi:hypothetical protein
MRCFTCVLLTTCVAQRHLGIARSGTAAGDERLDEVGPRLVGGETVPLPAGKARCLGAAGTMVTGGLGSGLSNRRAWWSVKYVPR